MSHAKLGCVFVHGWGMNKAVWQPVIEGLPDWIEPICVDLPGHGGAASVPLNNLQDMVDALAATTSRPSVWVGWSLGGLAVIQLAIQHASLVKGIMLVAASPSFIVRDDWPCGMSANIFDGFAEELEQDYSATVRRFLSLQVKGSERGRKTLKTLRQKIFELPNASPQALRSGLDLLKTSDLRTGLEQIQMPVSWVLGEQDGLVRADMETELKRLLPQADIHIVNKAAHAPFLSHTEEFNQQLVILAEKIHESNPISRKKTHSAKFQ